MRFFYKAMRLNVLPGKIAIDKSGASKAAIDHIIEDKGPSVIVRRVKYLNNMVGQGHRGIKHMTYPTLRFKPFRLAINILGRIELFHIIQKEQRNLVGCENRSFEEKFYVLANVVSPSRT